MHSHLTTEEVANVILNQTAAINVLKLYKVHYPYQFNSGENRKQQSGLTFTMRLKPKMFITFIVFAVVGHTWSQ